MIYVVQVGEKIKIGYSKHPETRIRDLQTGNPDQLICLGVINGTRRDESQIHRHLKKYRVSGEWFEVNETVMQYIDTIIAKDLSAPKMESNKSSRYQKQMHDSTRARYAEVPKIKKVFVFPPVVASITFFLILVVLATYLRQHGFEDGSMAATNGAVAAALIVIVQLIKTTVTRR